MMKGDEAKVVDPGDHGPTKLLHALTWGAWSNAPQVRACNYYIL